MCVTLLVSQGDFGRQGLPGDDGHPGLRVRGLVSIYRCVRMMSLLFLCRGLQVRLVSEERR